MGIAVLPLQCSVLIPQKTLWNVLQKLISLKNVLWKLDMLQKFQCASWKPADNLIYYKKTTTKKSSYLWTTMYGLPIKNLLYSYKTRRWLMCKSTRVTFEIFLIFMNGFHMYSQITSLSKWFSTIFTLEIFVIFMNCLDINPKRSSPSNLR